MHSSTSWQHASAPRLQFLAICIVLSMFSKRSMVYIQHRHPLARLRGLWSHQPPNLNADFPDPNHHVNGDVSRSWWCRVAALSVRTTIALRRCLWETMMPSLSPSEVGGGSTTASRNPCTNISKNTKLRITFPTRHSSRLLSPKIWKTGTSEPAKGGTTSPAHSASCKTRTRSRLSLSYQKYAGHPGASRGDRVRQHGSTSCRMSAWRSMS